MMNSYNGALFQKHHIIHKIQSTDKDILKALIPWQKELNEYGSRVLGSTKVYLQQRECSRGECNLGNFYTDAMVHAFIGKAAYNVDYWSNISIAITTQGNFRVPLLKGNLTYKHLITMCPWENKLIALTLKGTIIREILEDSVATMKAEEAMPSSSRFLQVSGLKVVYNITQPVGQRIKRLQVRCQNNCRLPFYEDLNNEQDYRLVVMEYLANGKNGFELIFKNGKDIEIGPDDLEAFINYMRINEPIITGLDGRITILK